MCLECSPSSIGENMTVSIVFCAASVDGDQLLRAPQACFFVQQQWRAQTPRLVGGPTVAILNYL